MSERWHQIDLHQIEVITKLHTKLGADLQLWNTYLQALALNEVQGNRERLRLATHEEGKPPTEEQGQQLVQQQTQIIKSLKHSIWNTSNTLKQLHEQRERATRVSAARAVEVQEAQVSTEDLEEEEV